MAHVKPTLDVSISTDCKTLTVTDTTPFTDDDDTTTADAGFPKATDTNITLKITYKATAEDNVRFDAAINAASSTVLDIESTKDGWYLLEITIKNSYTATDTDLTGTVDPTKDSTTLNGTGTSFTSEAPAGTRLEIGGGIYYVASVTSDTILILEEKYADDTATGLTAVKDPTFSFAAFEDAVVFCNAIKCRDEKDLNIVKDNLCGCEPSKDLKKVETIASHIRAIEVKSKKDTADPSGAQRIAELLDELCKDCNTC